MLPQTSSADLGAGGDAHSPFGISRSFVPLPCTLVGDNDSMALGFKGLGDVVWQ